MVGLERWGLFSGFGYLVEGLEVWRLGVLKVIVNYDINLHVTYIKSASVVHLFPFFSIFLFFLLPIFSFYSYYST